MTTNYHTPYQDGITTYTAADMNIPLSELDTQLTVVNSYIVGNYFGSVPVNSQLILAHVFGSVSSTFPEDLTGSAANAETAATAETIFIIRRNTTQIGTITFAAAGTTGSFSFSADVTFVQNQVLKVYAPASADATLGGISITLVGTRS